MALTSPPDPALADRAGAPASAAEAPGDVSRRIPQLAAGAEIAPDEHGSGDVVFLPPDRLFEVSGATGALLRLIDGRRDLAEIARRLAEASPHPLGPGDLHELIVRQFAPAGLVHFGEGARVGRAPRSALWLRVPLVPARIAGAVASALTWLFRAPAAPLALAAIAASHAWFYAARPDLALATAEGAAVAAWPVAVLLFLLSNAVHEFGHAAALRAAGERPGALGVGVYAVWPVFFADVQRAWRLPRRGRVIVDLGGIYFQSLAAVGFAALAILARDPAAARAFVLVDLAVIANLNPFLRLDGYWLASDLSGTRDLRARSAQVLRNAVRGRASGPRSRFLGIYAGLSLAYVVALIALFVAFVLPALPGRVDGAWAALVERVRHPGGGLAWLESALTIAFVALIAVGAVVTAAGGAIGLVRALRVRRGDRPGGAPAPGAWPDLGLAARSLLAIREGRRRVRRLGAAAGDPVHLTPVMLSSTIGAGLPPARLRALARRFLDARVLMELDHAELLRGGRAHRVRNPEPLLEVARSGRGMLVCALHAGPFFYVAAEMAMLGLDVHVLATGAIIDRQAQRIFESARERGVRLSIHRVQDPSSVKQALRTLREGGVVLVYMDGQGGSTARGHHHTDFTFAGIDLQARTGAAFLARRAGVATVLAVALREGPARRAVEFSDPIPPGAEGDDGAALTRRMFAWFEPFVVRHPEQWSGWTFPFHFWRSTGTAPTASPEEVERTRARVRTLLSSGRARLTAEPTRVGCLERNDRWIIIQGPTRRVLKGDPLTCAVLREAFRRVPLAALARRVRTTDADALADAVTRLVLAGLARLEGDGRAAPAATR
jgi:putative peptide zinc metalloprotease protein